MQYRCQTNIFGYCTRIPKPSSHQPPTSFKTISGVHVYDPPPALSCIADWETCCNFVSWAVISENYQVKEAEG